eukprot:m.47683 g.47683  ORF g.47683 m.47683 type:complete len:72 (-) comp17688_c1_seq1:139-354(-)
MSRSSSPRRLAMSSAPSEVDAAEEMAVLVEIVKETAKETASVKTVIVKTASAKTDAQTVVPEDNAGDKKNI